MHVASNKHSSDEGGGSNGNGPGRNGDRPWWKNIGTAIGLGGLVIACASLLLQKKLFNQLDNVDIAITKILQSECKHVKPNPFVERTLTFELKYRLDRDTKEGTSSSLLQTTLVCGPRGSGKSTLVANVLEGKTGIVPISYQGSSDDEFALAVLEALKVPCPQGVQPLSLVNEALVGIHD